MSDGEEPAGASADGDAHEATRFLRMWAPTLDRWSRSGRSAAIITSGGRHISAESLAAAWCQFKADTAGTAE